MIICDFCQKEVPHFPMKILEKNDIQVFYCETCRAEYIYHKRNEFVSARHLYTTIKDKTYRWSISYYQDDDDDGFHKMARLYYIKDPGLPGISYNLGMELLQRFEPGHYSVITPENIINKIKFMLLFL
jgi:hypothetical protein